MTTATARHLRLVTREELDQKVAAAVREFDERIAPRDPIGSPVMVGVLEKFQDPYWGESVSWRMVTVGNYKIAILLPVEADTNQVAVAVRELVDTVLSELEPG